MGQKIHPIGFRVGVNRKWNYNWFATGAEWKKLFFYQKEVETFFRYLFHFYSYTKISRRKRVLLFDVKFFKYNLNKLFIFVFFYKFRTKRRKEVRPTLKKVSIVLPNFKKRLKKTTNKTNFNKNKFFLVNKSLFSFKIKSQFNIKSKLKKLKPLNFINYTI